MANECLVTKLKAAVNNNDLPKFGILRVNCKLNPNGDQSHTEQNVTVIYPVSGTQKAKVYDANGNLLKTYSKENSNSSIVVSLGTYPADGAYIEFDGKYDITSFLVTNGYAGFIIRLDTSEFKYLTSLNNYNINNQDGGIYNQPSALSDLLYKKDNLQQIVTGVAYEGRPLTGQITEFANVSSLQSIECRYCSGITGTLEDYVEALFAKYAGAAYTQDKTVSINVANSITFNGIVIYGPTTITITSSLITLTGQAEGTYDGTNWTKTKPVSA